MLSFAGRYDGNFIFRISIRLDYTNESDILAPFLIRLFKLTKFRLELSKFGFYIADLALTFFLGWRN